MPDIGDRIRAAREQAGLTQRQLAEAVGVSDVLVTLWENKKHPRRITEEHRGKVAEILDLPELAPPEGSEKPARSLKRKTTYATLNEPERALLDLFRTFDEKLQLLQLANFVECAKLRKAHQLAGHESSDWLPSLLGTDSHTA